MIKKTYDHPVETSKEIRKLLLKALDKKGWYFFKNPQLSKCWEEMKCENIQCPSYKSLNLRCWQVSGTFCNGEPQGEFARKFGDCQKCKVYKKATEGNPILQIGEDFNNLMFQLKMKEEELTLSIRNSEKKNRELTALNDEINDLVGKLDNKNTLLKDLSIKDGLTGLYNYRFFRELLNEQYKLAKRYKFSLSCIMIDIDYFKAINDTYGHQCGDVILSQLADVLRNNVRETDKIVRYGGEEFAILFPYTDEATAYMKAEKIRQTISGFSFKIGKNTLGITISLGVAAYHDGRDVNKAEQLVIHADKALYLAKARGRNQTVIYGKTAVRENGKKTAARLLEKRRHPRIQALIKVKGRMGEKEIFSGNIFDISYSGLSLLRATPVHANKTLSIKLYMPDLRSRKGRSECLDIEGSVVRCRKICDFSIRHPGSAQSTEMLYLIGIQFSNISSEDISVLKKYFISMFKS